MLPLACGVHQLVRWNGRSHCTRIMRLAGRTPRETSERGSCNCSMGKALRESSSATNLVRPRRAGSKSAAESQLAAPHCGSGASDVPSGAEPLGSIEAFSWRCSSTASTGRPGAARARTLAMPGHAGLDLVCLRGSTGNSLREFGVPSAHLQRHLRSAVHTLQERVAGISGSLRKGERDCSESVSRSSVAGYGCRGTKVEINK